MKRQVCTSCKCRKAISAFSMNGRYRRAQCKSCRNKHRKQWRQDNSESQRQIGRRYYEKNKHKILNRGRKRYAEIPVAVKQRKRKTAYNEQYDKRLLYLYGDKAPTYSDLLKFQKGRCAICESKTSRSSYHKRFAMDHCHKTGRIRGLLCHVCNTRLGWFERHPDSILEYVKR